MSGAKGRSSAVGVGRAADRPALDLMPRHIRADVVVDGGSEALLDTAARRPGEKNA